MEYGRRAIALVTLASISGGVLARCKTIRAGDEMLIGIDWGGTKIEGIAMEPDGRELLRARGHASARLSRLYQNYPRPHHPP
jgi:hypothetical protein